MTASAAVLVARAASTQNPSTIVASDLSVIVPTASNVSAVAPTDALETALL
jgi:hypothetical protein